MKNTDKGFTLVELAIVLVIIGLLVAGVLAGQELIVQAKVRNMLAQIREYDTATLTFRSKYNNGMPGDFNKAHQFGLDKNSAGNLNVSGTACDNNDGNGDGLLSNYTSCTTNVPTDNIVGEPLNFWVHLSNAGLVKGSFSQVNDCTYLSCRIKAGEGVPEASLGDALIVLSNLRDNTLNYLIGLNPFDTNGDMTDFAIGYLPSGLLTPEEAYALDSKLDDGKPDKGMVQSTYSYIDQTKGLGYFSNEVQFGTTFSSTSCYTGQNGDYNITNANKACLLRIRASS